MKNIWNDEKKADCIMTQLGESHIDGFGVWLYEIDSPLGKIYIVQHERKDKTLETAYKDSKDEAEKLYKKQIKKLIAEN